MAAIPSWLYEIAIWLVVGLAIGAMSRAMSQRSIAVGGELPARRENGWTILETSPAIRWSFGGVGVACVLTFGFFLALMTLDYKVERLTTEKYYACLAVFVAFIAIGVYLAVYAFRATIRFDSDELEWDQIVVRRRVKWTELAALSDHPIFGVRAHLKSGRAFSVGMSGLKGFSELKREAASRRIELRGFDEQR